MGARLASWCALSVCSGVLAVAGCSNEPVGNDPSGVGAGDGCVDLDRDGYGSHCSLGPDCNDRDATQTECGAPRCASNDPPRPCYSTPGVDGKTLQCRSGYQYCEAGQWTTCRLTKEYSVSAPWLLSSVITGPTVCNPCNPACNLSTDYPTDADLTPSNSTGVIYDPGAGGITLDSPTGGGMTSLPDGDGDGVPDVADDFPADPTRDGVTEKGGIFHQLPLNAPQVYDPLEITSQVRSADVYFLMDTTGSMQAEINNLRASLTTGTFIPGCPGGLMGAIRCTIPDSQFGVGYHDDFAKDLYGTNDPKCTDATTGTVHDKPYVNLQDITANIPAAQAAVNKLVAKCGQDTPESQLPALFSIASAAGVPDFGSMPTGGFVSVTGNETQATAIDAGNVTTTEKKYKGDTTSMKDDYAYLGCGATTARDAVYKFSLTAKTDILISTADSTLKTIVHLLDSSFKPIICSANTYGSSNNGSLINRLLDPGTYYVVVEGRSTNKGAYQLIISPNYQAGWIAPKTTCPAGTFGYPCFRTGAVPIVVLISDARFHGGPDDEDYVTDGDLDASYWFPVPRYPEALRELVSHGVKVIGINSDAPPDKNCSYPCLTHTTKQVCGTNSVCIAEHTVTTCSDVKVCYQGGICTIQTKCSDKTVCDAYGTKYECKDQTSCSKYATTQVCELQYETSQWQMRQLAKDTGAVDETGEPLVYNIDGKTGLGLDTSIVTAVSKLAQASRMSTTLRINDNAATAIDERGFVKTIVTVPTPETDSRCIATHADWFEGCLPGTKVKFSVGFQNTMVAGGPLPQVFNFGIDMVGDGVYVLSSTPVRIVVPPDTGMTPKYVAGTYSRTYDASNVCKAGSWPDWGDLSWMATLPADTSIRWDIRGADSAAGLATAVPVSVTTPPATSPVAVRALLQAGGQSTGPLFLKLTANLLPSADGSRAPTLTGFEVRYTCLDSE